VSPENTVVGERLGEEGGGVKWGGKGELRYRGEGGEVRCRSCVGHRSKREKERRPREKKWWIQGRRRVLSKLHFGAGLEQDKTKH